MPGSPSMTSAPAPRRRISSTSARSGARPTMPGQSLMRGLGGSTDGGDLAERDTAAMQSEPIHPAVRIGHVHLRVADLDRAIAFYRDCLGFRVSADARRIGLDMAFLAAGDYHHHVGLNALESAGGTPPPGGHTGLYH